LKQSVEVTIGGQRYVLKSDGNGEHLRALADFVNRKLEEVRGVAKSLSPERLAILAALNIADELLRERDEAHTLRTEVRRRSEAVLSYLQMLRESAQAEDTEDAPARPPAGPGE